VTWSTRLLRRIATVSLAKKTSAGCHAQNGKRVLFREGDESCAPEALVLCVA
jgi:hypothetical protein